MMIIIIFYFVRTQISVIQFFLYILNIQYTYIIFSDFCELEKTREADSKNLTNPINFIYPLSHDQLSTIKQMLLLDSLQFCYAVQFTSKLICLGHSPSSSYSHLVGCVLISVFCF